jgi:hypothetical protein
MTLTIDLPPELEKTVRQQAAKNGQDVGAFVLQAVNEKLAKAPTNNEIGASVAPPVPNVSDEFYAELGRLPETVEAFEAQKTIFREWRSDARFKPYWEVLDHALARSFEQVQKWVTARAAVADLEGYDFEAYRKQREYDQQHAGDHVL